MFLEPSRPFACGHHPRTDAGIATCVEGSARQCCPGKEERKGERSGGVGGEATTGSLQHSCSHGRRHADETLPKARPLFSCSASLEKCWCVWSSLPHSSRERYRATSSKVTGICNNMKTTPFRVCCGRGKKDDNARPSNLLPQ